MSGVKTSSILLFREQCDSTTSICIKIEAPGPLKVGTGSKKVENLWARWPWALSHLRAWRERERVIFFFVSLLFIFTSGEHRSFPPQFFPRSPLVGVLSFSSSSSSFIFFPLPTWALREKERKQRKPARQKKLYPAKEEIFLWFLKYFDIFLYLWDGGEETDSLLSPMNELPISNHLSFHWRPQLLPPNSPSFLSSPDWFSKEASFQHAPKGGGHSALSVGVLQSRRSQGHTWPRLETNKCTNYFLNEILNSKFAFQEKKLLLTGWGQLRTFWSEFWPTSPPKCTHFLREKERDTANCSSSLPFFLPATAWTVLLLYCSTVELWSSKHQYTASMLPTY